MPHTETEIDEILAHRMLNGWLTTPHKLRPEARSRKRTGRRLVVHAVHNPMAEDVSFMR